MVYVRQVPAARCLEHDRLQFPGSPFGIDESASVADGLLISGRPGRGTLPGSTTPSRSRRRRTSRGGLRRRCHVGSVSHRDEVPDDC